MASNAQRLLVFGSTGGTGAEVVREATLRGWQVGAFIRDPARAGKAFANLIHQPELFRGDATVQDDVRAAFQTRFDAVVDTMGIYQTRTGRRDLTNATGNILNSMQASGVRRYICVSSIGVGDSAGQGNFVVRLIQRTSLKRTLEDKQAQEDLIRASRLDWTIIRPSRLVNGSGPARYVTWEGPQPDTPLAWSVNRSDVASLALECIGDDATIEKALHVTGAR